MAGLLAGYCRWHEPFDPFSTRRGVTLNRTADFPAGGMLLIGDSTVERLHLPTLCNLPVFNAGLSSARSDQVRPMVPELLKRLRPRRVVTSLGSNDLRQGRAGWERDVAAIAPRGAIIVGISSDGPGDRAAANRFLARLAAERGGRFVAALPVSKTSDGVHADAARPRRVETARRRCLRRQSALMVAMKTLQSRNEVATKPLTHAFLPFIGPRSCPVV
ncbi:SGNH/GDSL hydrolase family protein [Sphingopyxis sp. PET50]|uniref:SGNH/GDSL hydrolase family protein n=1 Tax=Sphingopyxis sp. PET50 TaxID=2976533 RepID=UPI0021B08BD6|nr:SGNH/GDSL hydrolase family protein [Sphingopyxis sp. PET50]